MTNIAFTIHNKDLMLSHLISNLSILDNFELLQELMTRREIKLASSANLNRRLMTPWVLRFTR